MNLSPAAVRVLGALAEKSLTTPQQYPLSLSALVTACNQRSARDPVTDLTEGQVQTALRELRAEQLVRSASSPRSRVVKQAHALAEQLDLDVPEQAVLALLLLRGPQTVGEVRIRSERMYPFDDLQEVEATLERLASHHLLPLVVELPREPGRREARWAHLLGGAAPAGAGVVQDGAAVATDGAAVATDVGAPGPHASPDATAARPGRPDGGDLASRVAELERQVAELRERLDEVL